MIPSYKQWKAWSLPSKYTAIGLLIAIISLVLVFFPLNNSNSSQVVSGKIYVNSFDEIEVNYGVNFISKPKLEIQKDIQHIKVIEQRTDGFKYKVEDTLFDNITLVWSATGKVLTK